MLQAIKNWFFKRWVLENIRHDANGSLMHLRIYLDDKYFYQAKHYLRRDLAGVDLIEIADGILTVVKGRCVAKVEV